MACSSSGVGGMFQSTHPRGVRHGIAPSAAWRGGSFNPRTRVGCDHSTRETASKLWAFQSTHPRGVRPGERDQAALVQAVSIHAPAWGATGPGRDRAGHGQGFNPRTRVGCDAARSRYPLCRGCFNPRTRVGCDIPQSVASGPGIDVSIHAPAWGATERAQCGSVPRDGFNPRTRVGCDCFHVLSSRFP